MGLKINNTKTKVISVYHQMNLNDVLIENVEGYVWDNMEGKNKKKRYIEESWPAGRHTPNTLISSKATLSSARKDRSTIIVCC